MSAGGQDHSIPAPELTLGIDPVGIQVRQSGLVAGVFDGLRGLLVDETAGPSPPATFGLRHVGVRG